MVSPPYVLLTGLYASRRFRGPAPYLLLRRAVAHGPLGPVNGRGQSGEQLVNTRRMLWDGRPPSEGATLCTACKKARAETLES